MPSSITTVFLDFKVPIHTGKYIFVHSFIGHIYWAVHTAHLQGIIWYHILSYASYIVCVVWQQMKLHYLERVCHQTLVDCRGWHSTSCPGHMGRLRRSKTSPEATKPHITHITPYTHSHNQFIQCRGLLMLCTWSLSSFVNNADIGYIMYMCEIY